MQNIPCRHCDSSLSRTIFDHLTITFHRHLSFLSLEEKSAFLKNQFPYKNRFVFDTVHQMGQFEKIKNIKFVYNYCSIFEIGSHLNTVKNERLVVPISLVTTNRNKLQVQGRDFSPKMSCSVTYTHISHLTTRKPCLGTSACTQWRINSVWATNPID